MLKRIFCFLGNLLGWCLISAIVGAFIFFLSIIVMLFAGLPLLPDKTIDPIMSWWISYGPYVCFALAFILTIVVERNSPLFTLRRDLTTKPPDDRTS